VNLLRYIYLPLGALGLVRWLSWLVHRIPAAFYRPVTTGYRESLAVVTPVYQEDPDIFRQAIESWLANGVDEVICVIDFTDTVCRDIAAEYPVRIIMTEVPGKRDALRKGWEAASTVLVALVDSDTIWAPDVRARVCEPFVDPKVGVSAPARASSSRVHSGRTQQICTWTTDISMSSQPKRSWDRRSRACQGVRRSIADSCSRTSVKNS